MLTEFIILGVLGGFVRALYGLLKAINEGTLINKMYFLVTLVISGAVGGLLGVVFDMDYRVACLAGYVGTDVLENVVNSVLPSSVLIKK